MNSKWICRKLDIQKKSTIVLLYGEESESESDSEYEEETINQTNKQMMMKENVN